MFRPGTDMLSNLSSQYNTAITQAAGGMAAQPAISQQQQAAAGAYGAAGGYPAGVANNQFLGGASSYVNAMTAQQQGPFPQQSIASQVAPAGYGAQQAGQYQQPAAPQQASGRAPRARAENKAPSDAFDGEYKQPELRRMEEIAVEITKNPHDFICLLQKYFKDVDATNDSIETIFSSGKNYSIPSAKVKQGMACVAPFVESDSTMYYRARVEQISRSEATVFFVDYGNEAIVNLQDLKYLPKSCATVPVSCIRCMFDSVSPSEGSTWSNGALMAFTEYLVGDFTCYIKGTSGDKQRVELFPANGDLEQPISVELERRGVLKRVTEIVGQQPRGDATRGRRANTPREPEPRGGNRGRSPSPEERPRRGRVEKVEREGRVERTDNSRQQRSVSPSSESTATNELQRANYKPARVRRSGFVDITICGIQTPSKFTVQLQADKERLQDLESRMADLYEDSKDDDFLEDSPIPYTAVAVQTDSGWQRGYTLTSSYHGCQVVLVDTQEIVSVDQDNLRVIRTDFQRLPAQGLKCSLDGIQCVKNKWAGEASRFFKELVAESSSVVAEFRAEKSGVYQTRVFDGDRMLNAMFVVKNFATTRDNEIQESVREQMSAKSSKFGMVQMPAGTSVTVKPCHVVGPTEFYVHIVSNQHDIEEMCGKVNDFYNSQSREMPRFTVDEYCAAYWEEEWFRARIQSVSKDSCEVYFLDYGNVDAIHNDEMRGLNKQFKKQPMYAVKCSLEGLDPSQLTSMTEIFSQLVDAESEDDATFHATFIKRDKDTYLVSLWDEENVPLLKKMYEMLYSGKLTGRGSAPPARRAVKASSSSAAGQAVSSIPAVEIRSKDIAYITHANDPTMLFIQGEREGECQAMLDELTAKMNQIYNSNPPPLRSRQTGELCCTRYSEDNEWTRGQIVAVHGDSIQVLFVDYGNQETKRGNEVYALDRSLAGYPSQTTPCQLADIGEPPSGWADASNELYIISNTEVPCKFSVIVQDPSTSPVTVELYHTKNGASLSNELILNGYGVDPTRQCIPMGQTPSCGGGSFHAKVASADYPGRMYVQKLEENEKLEEIMCNMQKMYGSAGNRQRLIGEPKIGGVCCAQYSDDEQYYRATIFGITRNTIKIQFTDYGNCEDKQRHELYQLADEFLPLDSQAIECNLDGCNVTSFQWTPAMQANLEDAVFEKVYNCSIIGKESEAYTVKLVCMSTGNSLADDINRFVSGGGAAAANPGATNSFGATNGACNAGAAAANTGFGNSGFGGDNNTSAPAPQPPKTDEVVKIEWPPRVDKFEHVPAMISYGDGPEEFWINLVDKDSKLDQLQAKLQEVYGSGAGTPVNRIFRYMYIAAKSPEYGEVFRAKTLNNDRNAPLVTYVDFGNEEEVPKENLYMLEPYLASVLPCQAVRCALDNVDSLKPEGELKEEIKAKFEELLADQEIMVKNISPAQREKPHNEVDILIKGQSVLENLEKELIALSGPPDIELCKVQVGTVVKGSLVNITSANDFWIQLAGPIARICEAMKVCTDKLSEAPEVGTYCAVVLEDDTTVYRARAEAVEGSKVTVTCIDHGYKRTLPMSSIYRLKQSCGEHPAQAFPCSLPVSVTEEKETEVKGVLEKLSANTLTVKIYSSENKRFMVDFTPTSHTTLLCDTGAATSTLPSLQDIATAYSFQAADAEMTYFVSHTNDLSSFYVQKSDLDADELNGKVTAACSGNLPSLANPTRGSPCVVKDSVFKAWNRAIVTDILEGDMAKILFLDYGSVETVKRSTLKTLPECLHEITVGAVKCSLDPLPENHAQFTELFTTITADRELTITPTACGVSVLVDGLPVTEVFDKATHYAALRYTRPEPAETCNVYCTTVEDPFNIWVQLAEYEEQLGTVMAALTEYCPAAPALYSTAPGTVCAALFPDDETWYRGEITKEGVKCTVKFVDYGNTCEVEKAALKLLPVEHLTLPANCLLVRLAHVRPKTGGTKWDDASIDKLYELTTEKLCEMKMTSLRAFQHVTLSFEGADIGEAMGEVANCTADPEMLHFKDLDIPAGDSSVFITHVETAGHVFGQLDDNAEAIEGLGAVTDEGLVSVDQVFKPLQCWAKWQDALYRAQIIDFTPTEVSVCFVDYGNKDKVAASQLWYLNPEHVELPAQAIPLKLDGVKPVSGGEWATPAKTTLSGLVLEQSVAVTLPESSGVNVSTEPLATRMTVEEVDVADALKAARVARSLIQPPVVSKYTESEFAEETTVYCTQVELQEDESVTVTCQLGGAKLQEITDLLQTSISAGHPDYVPEALSLGMPCVCKFSTDGLWYRADITKIEGEKVSVTFVDYGNCEVVKPSEIQLLPEQFSSPVQMVTVSLAGSGTMSSIDKMFLTKMMVVENEIVMIHKGEEASFSLIECNEDGEEISRSDAVDATKAHSAAVGSYPSFPLLPAETVTYSCQIESVQEIYMQIDGCEETLEAITEQMTSHTEKTPIEAPFLGQPVLAVFQELLYRATVIKSEGGKHTVRYVDYGNSSVVTQVFEILPEEVSTPPQAIRCAIDMATPAAGKDLKPFLSTSLADKALTIVSGPTEATPSSGTVNVSLAVDGANIRLKMLQQGLIVDEDCTLGSYERVQLPRKPVEVVVTHLEGDKLFFGQRTGLEKVEPDEDEPVPEDAEPDEIIDADTFVTEMQAILEDAMPPVLDTVIVGSLCVTRWEGDLYRASVLWTLHDFCKVRFVDYGNTWYCALSEVLDCPEPYRGPGLAIPLRGNIDNKPVSADTEYLVEQQEGEGTGTPVSVSKPLPKLLKYKYTKPELDSAFTAFVSQHLEHGNLYVQTEAGGEELETVLAPLIATAVTAAKPLPNLVVEAPVIGKYLDQFYRGKVVEVVKPGVAKVLFVDYGNTETCTSLYDTSPGLMAVRVLSINCQLDGISFVGVESKPIYDEHTATDAELTLTPISYCKDKKQFTVSVVAGEVDVNAAITTAHVPDKSYPAVESTEYATNTYLPFYCANFNSVQDICLQVEEDVPMLDTIAAATAACTKVLLHTAKQGQVCLVSDPKDKLFYRARVTSTISPPCDDVTTTADDVTTLYALQYVDYGNRETLPINSLYDIPVEVTQHKVCGIPAKLAATKIPQSGCDATNLAALKKLCNPEVELAVSVMSRDEEMLVVQVLAGKENLRDHVQGEALDNIPTSYCYPNTSSAMELFVSVVNNPTDMYGQREQDGPKLEIVSALIESKTEKSVILEELVSGIPCIAQSVADEVFYRAAVLSVEEEGVTVRYVDYGNTEQVPATSVHPIPASLLSIPVLAVPLSLHAVQTPEAWSEDCMAALGELVAEDTFLTVTPKLWSSSHKCEGDLVLEGERNVKTVLLPHLTCTE